MSNPAPICTHIKANGTRCGSPAARGTAQCFHHSAIKTALGKVTPLEKVSYGSFTPIPFVFPEDRASMQINYFLLLQALNEQRVEKRAAEVMLRMLKAMDKNLGKSGSLVDSDGAVSDEAVSEKTVSKTADSHEAISRVIDEVNASAPCYADYREVSALHPAGQRVLNICCQPPMGR